MAGTIIFPGLMTISGKWSLDPADSRLKQMRVVLVAVSILKGTGSG